MPVFSSHLVHQLGTDGNLEGDGYHLGGVFVLGPGEEVKRRIGQDGTNLFPQGIVYEHREGSWGDNVNTTEVSILMMTLVVLKILIMFKSLYKKLTVDDPGFYLEVMAVYKS